MPRVNSDPPLMGDWGGRASFNGAVVTIVRSARDVRALLPSPLTLLDDEAEHPLIFVFGELTSGGAHFGGFDLPIGARYREIGVMIPRIRHPAERGPLLFPHAMLADDLTAVGLGNAFYGLRKRLVPIDWTGPIFRASDRGRVLFESSARLAGAWSRESTRGNADFERLIRAFSLPVIGLRDSGQFVRSHFAWDLREAEACAIQADVSYDAGGRNLGGRSLAENAFAIRGLVWRTTPPKAIT